MVMNDSTIRPPTEPAGTLLSGGPARTALPRIIAVTSGKRGVGKTNLVVNVAIELAMRRRVVTILNADNNGAGADEILGISCNYHLGQAIRGQCQVSELVTKGMYDIGFVTGGKGLPELTREHDQLINDLQLMVNESDFVIVDTPSGVSNSLKILCAASEVVIVTTPDTTDIVDSYAIVKSLHSHAPTKPIWIVVNNAVSIRDADEVVSQLNTISMRFLKHKIECLGAIPQDTHIAKAISMQRPIVEYAPDRPSSRSFRVIAKYFLDSNTAPSTNPAGTFWRTLVEMEL
ncbi:MAG: P-loop NTPase [Acidobacteriota bacterium]